MPLGMLTAVSAASKALYKPLSIATSVAGGLLAGKIFTEIWQRVSPSDQEPPEPKDLPLDPRGAHRRRGAGFDLRLGAGGSRPGKREGLSGRHP